MSSAEILRIGLVGCGLWGRNIARDLLELGCRVTCADSNDEARSNAASLGMTAVSSLDDLPRVDGIVVATPASTHHEVVSRALTYDVPVFCEKPLTTDSASARTLRDQAPNRLFVMHNWRYHPGVRALAAIADSGELGRVEALKSVRANWTSPRTDTDSIWTLVPHDITLAIAILGFIPEPLCARIERAGERIVGMNALLGSRPWFSLESSNRYGDRRREVRLHCENGVAVLPSAESTALEIHTGHDREPIPACRQFDPVPALEAELKVFVDYLRGGPPPVTTALEGVRVVETVEALRRLAN